MDAGDTEMFGMTLFVKADASPTEGSHPDNQIQGLKDWIGYARTQNPDTIFFVGLPWLGGPRPTLMNPVTRIQVAIRNMVKPF